MSTPLEKLRRVFGNASPEEQVRIARAHDERNEAARAASVDRAKRTPPHGDPLERRVDPHRIPPPFPGFAVQDAVPPSGVEMGRMDERFGLALPPEHEDVEYPADAPPPEAHEVAPAPLGQPGEPMRMVPAKQVIDALTDYVVVSAETRDVPPPFDENGPAQMGVQLKLQAPELPDIVLVVEGGMWAAWVGQYPDRCICAHAGAGITNEVDCPIHGTVQV